MHLSVSFIFLHPEHVNPVSNLSAVNLFYILLVMLLHSLIGKSQFRGIGIRDVVVKSKKPQSLVSQFLVCANNPKHEAFGFSLFK